MSLCMYEVILVCEFIFCLPRIFRIIQVFFFYLIGRRSCMPSMDLPVALPPPRLSISERKAIPGLDLIPSRLPQSRPKVRKELNFEEEKENNDDDSNFARPLPVMPASLKEPTMQEKKSLAKMILTRESMAGLPRASLSGKWNFN